MQFDLRVIEAFAAVMRNGSLTRAEAMTGISKATLSRQLLALEQQLGATLFNRQARGMAPTEAGRAFFAHCESILNDVASRLDMAKVQIQELDTGVSGALSVLSDSEFSTTFVCHVAKLFLSRFPNVKFNLDIAGRPEAVDSAAPDCYVCATPPDIPNLIGKGLGRISYGLYASPIYLKRRGNPVTPLDVSKHESIVLKESLGHGKSAPMLHSSGGSQPYLHRSDITTNDYWVMKTFCIDGFGIALLPDFFVQPEVARRILVPVLPQWKPERRRIFCAYQKQRFAGKKLKEFVGLMSECIEDIDTYSPYVGERSTLRSSNIDG
ncbi:LysR family transcriptional regulator [Cupriavidus sp. D384]|uniref:LysR family transcriptional regulator n=1 Tax=Cupriavidus sp. D384 TaxID=1538095 RepID=UPI0009ECCA02|nr:LysR family transcriptional regulator [Cupriavidus sp. D384]